MEKITVSVSKEQYEKINKRVDNDIADSRSQATRQELRNANDVTPTRKTVDKLGNILAIAGLTMIGLTFFYPIQIRVFSLFPIFGSILCFGIGQYVNTIRRVVT